jgi:hypothetical protein
MTYANSLLSGAGDLEDGSASLSVGYGLRLQGALDLGGRLPQLYAAFWGTGTSAQEREVGARVSILGVGLGAEVRRDRWLMYAGLCGGRAAFSLPALDLVDLVGWGAGLELGGGFALAVSPKLSFVFRLGGQLLPVQEMKDARGQTYRGRGVPFVDYTGLAASIGVSWSP